MVGPSLGLALTVGSVLTVGVWEGTRLTVGPSLGCALAVGCALEVGSWLGCSLVVGGALEVGGALAVGPSVGTVEGESDILSTVGVAVGPVVGAKVMSGSLARHETSEAKFIHVKSHDILPGLKHSPPGFSTIALKKGSMHAAVAAKSSSMKLNAVVKLEMESTNTAPPAVPLMHDWVMSRLLRKAEYRTTCRVEGKCELTQGEK
jgi:hypothetical protein